MSAQEIVELCESLSPQKREEVVDFARFLLTREQDARWEAIIDDSSPRPRLEAFLTESRDESDEAFDRGKL